MRYKNKRFLVIGIEHLDFARLAYNQGAEVHLLNPYFYSSLFPSPFNLIRDDIDNWGDDWIPFKRTPHHKQIDIVVSDRIDKIDYFLDIAPRLLTKSDDITTLESYYSDITIEDDWLLCG